MGIDVYMRWKDQTQAEREAQYTGFSIVHGHVGYLREAYHGDPYATKTLVPEAFEAAEDGRGEDDGGGTPITADLLRSRLPVVLETCAERHRTVYQDSAESIAEFQQSYRNFVDLAARKEAETGEPVRIVVSG